jgi:MbtH protein
MDKDQTPDDTIYRVVANQEEQYSIWPAHRDNPPGWRDAGPRGSKTECLAYIGATWTDMRPLSLRRQMEQSLPTDRSTRPTSVIG